MHENSLLMFERYAKGYFRPGRRVLEIGPEEGGSSYRDLVGDFGLVWDTVDIWRTHHNLTYVAADEYSFPIPDNTYDIVVSGQVLEHVRKIWLWMPEVARVCRVEGLVITISPVSWPYHEAPCDCWRAFPEGMKALYEHAGLSVVRSQFESLESPGYARYIPGISPRSMTWRRRAVNRLCGALGLHFERAYDTITIGQKQAGDQKPGPRCSLG